MFAENERRVFKYFDGEKDVYADPLKVERKLRLLMGGDCNKIIEAMNNSDLVIEEDQATETFMRAMCEVFGLKMMDGSDKPGWTEQNVCDLWTQFQEWCAEKKTPLGNSPSSGASTAASGSPHQARV